MDSQAMSTPTATTTITYSRRKSQRHSMLRFLKLCSTTTRGTTVPTVQSLSQPTNTTIITMTMSQSQLNTTLQSRKCITTSLSQLFTMLQSQSPCDSLTTTRSQSRRSPSQSPNLSIATSTLAQSQQCAHLLQSMDFHSIQSQNPTIMSQLLNLNTTQRMNTSMTTVFTTQALKTTTMSRSQPTTTFLNQNLCTATTTTTQSQATPTPHSLNPCTTTSQGPVTIIKRPSLSLTTSPNTTVRTTSILTTNLITTPSVSDTSTIKSQSQSPSLSQMKNAATSILIQMKNTRFWLILLI